MFAKLMQKKMKIKIKNLFNISTMHQNLDSILF